MKLLMAFVLAPALTLGGDIDNGELDWLAGCWVTPDKSAQEVWIVESERSLAGFSITIRDSQVRFYEILSINQSDDGTWIYSAHPSGQSSASFSATEITESSVVFVNPAHDYPQEVRYRRQDKRLDASVSLLDGVNPTLFNKIACE